MMTGHDNMTVHDETTDEIETEADAAGYSLLRKIQKRRKEIQREIIELDSALALRSVSRSPTRFQTFNDKKRSH